MSWAPIVLVGFGIAGVAVAYLLGLRDGKEKTRDEELQRGIAAAERIAESASHAPVTRSDLLERLRDGRGL